MKSTSLLLFVSFAICGLSLVKTLKCDRKPEGTAIKTPVDGRFRLKIINDPVSYIPGERYSLTLEGITRYGQTNAQNFIGFYVAVESHHSDEEGEEWKAGKFSIVDRVTSQIYGKCKNVVTQTSSFPISEVPIDWKAPPPGSGCVVFRATVIEQRDVWYADEGHLIKVFCEDESDPGDSDPIIPTDCKACDEAKYELTFEGLWSRHTHPKDFPDNGWLTKFSDVIGASHTSEKNFWVHGEPASEGLKELVEQGTTGVLESELKEEGEHIRTIIKARGISYPNVTGKTFAVFRVDAEHHLVSLVSMIYPSPDWFVGISGFELCLANGSWVEEKKINLYPYDAGTDSGPTYISPNEPTDPREVIRRIKPNQPDDSSSPFHDPENIEMKPLARLILTRQRLYEKNCENQEGGDSEHGGGESGKDCAVTRWSDWSECSKPCGKGKRFKSREYKNSERGCNKKLKQYEDCEGTDDVCNDDQEDADVESDNQRNSDPECELTAFTPWSECSKQCGKGEMSRSRQYINKNNAKKCQKRNQAELEETIECDGQSCAGDLGSEEEKPQPPQSQPPIKKDPKGCQVGKWSPFSECSAKCGIGEKIKIRIPKKNQPEDENLEKIVNLYRKLNNMSPKAKHSRFNKVEEEEEEEEEDDDEANEDDDENGEEEDDMSDFDVMEISDSDHPCYGIDLIERKTCGERNKPCEDDMYGMPPFCLLKPSKQRNCNSKGDPENRWFFKKETRRCGIFTYAGCEGNENNFESEDLCMSTCARRMPNSLRSYSLVGYGGGKLNEKVDCKVSHWKHEVCNATCGEGYQSKYRSIIQHPQNGGLRCPRTMVKLERCYKDCGNLKVIASSPSRNPINSHHGRQHHRHCRYSEWSEWSPCSKTCGDSAVQIRTRIVLNHLNTHLCNERLEERRCEVLPCLVGRGYSYNNNYRS